MNSRLTVSIVSPSTSAICPRLSRRAKADLFLDRKSGRQVEQEGRHALFRRHPAEQQHPFARPVQLGQRALQQLVLKLGMFAREAVEIGAAEDADQHIGQRLDRIGGRLAERATDEIGGKGEAEDLLLAVGGAGRELQHPFHDIGDDDRIIPLPQQVFTRAEMAALADRIERDDLFIVEISADRAVANRAGVAEIRGAGEERFIHCCSAP